MLVTACFEARIDKLPFAISSQQYEYFVEEWNRLNEKIDE